MYLLNLDLKLDIVYNLISNFKSSEFTEKFELILFPEPKIFLSSIPKVKPAPVSALKVPAN